MLTSLLLLAATAGLAGPPAKQDPPIHIWYNSDGDFAYRDRAKVYARAAESGYVVVLRSDLNGRVRVLAPVDPRDDQHVDGGKKYELIGYALGAQHLTLIGMTDDTVTVEYGTIQLAKSP